MPLRGFFAAWQRCLPGQPIPPPRPAAAAAGTKRAERGTAGPGGLLATAGLGAQSPPPPPPALPAAQPSPAEGWGGDPGWGPAGAAPSQGPGAEDRAAACPAGPPCPSPRRGHRPFVCGGGRGGGRCGGARPGAGRRAAAGTAAAGGERSCRARGKPGEPRGGGGFGRARGPPFPGGAPLPCPRRGAGDGGVRRGAGMKEEHPRQSRPPHPSPRGRAKPRRAACGI